MRPGPRLVTLPSFFKASRASPWSEHLHFFLHYCQYSIKLLFFLDSPPKKLEISTVGKVLFCPVRYFYQHNGRVPTSTGRSVRGIVTSIEVSDWTAFWRLLQPCPSLVMRLFAMIYMAVTIVLLALISSCLAFSRLINFDLFLYLAY